MPHPKLRRTRPPIIFAALALILSLTLIDVQAQSGFQSGSTGANGPFSPGISQTVQLPENGIFNFTTVNIPTGVTIRFQRNAKNTPIIILATGNVVIQGKIDISGWWGTASGNGGAPGPGGFRGGDGASGVNRATGNAGDGPGAGGAGGAASAPDTLGGHGGGGGFRSTGTEGDPFTGGRAYATAALVNLIGGSGGGGGGAFAGSGLSGGGGGGGAGAIVIASSTSIVFGDDHGSFGIIEAEGGYGEDGNSSAGAGGGPGGGGAGGAIRLVANTISGSAELNVSGGETGATGVQFGRGSDGFVRVEANDQSAFNVFTGLPVSQALPSSAIQPNLPRLRIASIGGVATPGSPTGSFHTAPDITVPLAQSNPVSVVIEATNVPVGTVVQVTVIPATGIRSTVDSSALAGTGASSTATATVELPAETSAVVATAELNLTTGQGAPLFIDGERVERLVVAGAPGVPDEVTYVTKSGRRIKTR